VRARVLLLICAIFVSTGLELFLRGVFLADVIIWGPRGPSAALPLSSSGVAVVYSLQDLERKGFPSLAQEVRAAGGMHAVDYPQDRLTACIPLGEAVGMLRVGLGLADVATFDEAYPGRRAYPDAEPETASQNMLYVRSAELELFRGFLDRYATCEQEVKEPLVTNSHIINAAVKVLGRRV